MLVLFRNNKLSYENTFSPQASAFYRHVPSRYAACLASASRQAQKELCLMKKSIFHVLNPYF